MSQIFEEKSLLIKSLQKEKQDFENIFFKKLRSETHVTHNTRTQQVRSLQCCKFSIKIFVNSSCPLP